MDQAMLMRAVKEVAPRHPEIVPFLEGRARWWAHMATYVMSAEAKTYDGYFRQLWNRTRELYGGEITRDEFIDTLAELVQEQLTRAWRAALRDNDLDPELVNSTYAGQLEEMILSEYDHVDQFAADVVEAAAAGQDVGQFKPRCELWANRYNDAYNQAVAAIAEENGERLMWVYGDTEHCETCLQLNGIVAWATEWASLNLHPQDPPNPQLECGGWRCQCRLEITDQRRSPDALDTIMNIVIASG